MGYDTLSPSEAIAGDYMHQVGSIPVAVKPKGNPGGAANVEYVERVAAFDIETTRVYVGAYPHAIMYVWMFHLEGFPVVIGRTWDEFLQFTEALAENLQAKMLVFVHNLSYEFQFLRGVYFFDENEVFIIRDRKILRCDMHGKLEYRCSYLQTNMSLAELTAKMGVEHGKLSGEDFDYSKERYPWTPIEPDELAYECNDVLGLTESIRAEMERDGDTVYTLPLTSTGYVRRDAKKALRMVPSVRGIIPDYEVYKLAREAFRGGDTHANRLYTCKTVHDVESFDAASFYPYAMLCCDYPMGEWTITGAIEPERLAELMDVRKRAILMRVTFSDLKLIDEFFGCPYLPLAKCRDIIGGLFDNGRVLEAAYLETTITDMDLRVILEEYSFEDMVILSTAYTRYGKLPEAYRDVVRKYYHDKCSLKGDESRKVYYDKSKALLNALYGMMVQDPVREPIRYEENRYVESRTPHRELYEEAKRKLFLPYTWGVWVTANARHRLHEAIRAAGDGFVYCDTDSVKCLKGSLDLVSFNKQREREARENGGVGVDCNGIEHPIGVFERDGYYTEFRTMGAKKYGYRDEDGKLHITIAGVNKRKGADELERAGGLSAMQEGFTFCEAGGTESVYNDMVDIPYNVEGHELRITSNVAICDSTYTLGLTEEYRRVIERFDRVYQAYLF